MPTSEESYKAKAKKTSLHLGKKGHRWEAPGYCQYCSGPCDQDWADVESTTGFFAYPSEPRDISSTVGKAIKELKLHSSEDAWVDWRKLPIHGKLIFCEICKAIRATEVVVGDITTLNFNVLFELGYAIGAGKPVVPIRDTTYLRDKTLLEELGIFDTIGYKSFENSRHLVSLATQKRPNPVVTRQIDRINRNEPIYYMKSPIHTDINMKLNTCLKKSAFGVRTFDSRETHRLSMHDANRHIASCLSVVAHLVDANRTGAVVHNGLCAFVSGMGMAAGKRVLMLQEGEFQEPIDYRDVVVRCLGIEAVPRHIEQFLKSTEEAFLVLSAPEAVGDTNLLEKVDLGDIAAEYEERALPRYFVRTPQYVQCVKARGRLVVGRRGSGKTAIFYGVEREKKFQKNTLVINLKPEGDQLLRLRERVLQNMSPGFQLHLLTGFWNYILSLEVAHRILETMEPESLHDPKSFKRFRDFQKLYKQLAGDSGGDFSERLMAIVKRVTEAFPDFEHEADPHITEFLYKGDIQEINDQITYYLAGYDEIWLLFDNIDKAWPSHGAKEEDIAILHSLLEAARKLQRQLEKEKVAFGGLVFVRKEIFDLLLDRTPDRGKEAVVNLDWSDEVLLRELLRKRLCEGGELTGDFTEVWQTLVNPHVGGEDSFRYVLERTFLQPRELLNFVRKCVDTAIARGHARVEEQDIMHAEKAYSEDMLNALRYEMRDVWPGQPSVLDGFTRKPASLSKDDLVVILLDAGIPETEVENTIDRLIWFSFVGVACGEDMRFSYQAGYNVNKVKSYITSESTSAPTYCIHPGFHAALEVT